MDDPVYAKNAVKKIEAYENNGIYPGERLILTFETECTILNTQTIEKLVHKYLLWRIIFVGMRRINKTRQILYKT